MNQSRIMLGVLGGLGPMSTFRFCQMLTEHTPAVSDADHIDMIVSSRATTPDRTAFILEKSDLDPLPVMIEEAHRLQNAGVDLIVIPCNTAHYFYNGLQKECRVPIINIIAETVSLLKRMGMERIGLLATEGTVSSGAYHTYCQRDGIECIAPSAHDQGVISRMIYEDIKQNKPIDYAEFNRICHDLQEKGCQRLILGCTELSLLDKSRLPSHLLLDAMDVLACKTILSCKKHPIGFPEEITRYLIGGAQ